MKRKARTAIPPERRSPRLSKKAKSTSIDLTEELEPTVEAPVFEDSPNEPEPTLETPVPRNNGLGLPELRKAFLSRLKGQDTTLNKLSNILYEFNAKCRHRTPGMPMILPLFLSGVSGTGKTSSIKILCELFGIKHGVPGAYVYKDMSEIVKQEDITKILGSAPSYAGFGEKNFIDQLCEAVGEKGFTTTKKTTTTATTRKSKLVIKPNKTAPPEAFMVHFEEVDKAHHTALTVLINFLETGRLTSGNGREFVLPEKTKMILVFTANFGFGEIAELSYLTDFQRARDAVIDDMMRRGIEKPMIGRFPHILPFFPLPTEVTEQIASDSISVLFEEVEFQYKDYFEKFSYKKESEALLKKALSAYTSQADPELGWRSVEAICEELKRELCCETMSFIMEYMTQEKLPLRECPMLDVLNFSPDLMEDSDYFGILDRCELNTTTYHLIRKAWEEKISLVLVLVEYKERIMTSIVVHSEVVEPPEPAVVNSLVIVNEPVRKYCDRCGHFSKNYQRVRCPETIGSKIRMIFKNYCNLCIYNNSIIQTRSPQLQLQPLLL